ncbi:MAG: hypothetical protein CYPHOPRED_004923 [Cyphobasidiales sp. Tagirdzhanova-0007]|nr:MAG: hypothetical protein CYPHOPRED_004923 [Cyphobasidiales sp. Tagirdzhanova-0007]
MSLEDSTAHKLARTAVDYAGGPAQSFAPINQICQCVIYDRDAPDAKLIGIECEFVHPSQKLEMYIVDEATFLSLDKEEKRYWHSHSYEVESGTLAVVQKTGVPRAVIDMAERPVLQDLRRTFGKTVHTWQVDKHPDLPLGPPSFMMSMTKEGQVDEKLLAERDAAIARIDVTNDLVCHFRFRFAPTPHIHHTHRLNISTADKKEQRKIWLDPPVGEYKLPEGVDSWQETGQGIYLDPVPRKMKLD